MCLLQDMCKMTSEEVKQLDQPQDLTAEIAEWLDMLRENQPTNES